jgi:hypothetical protein
MYKFILIPLLLLVFNVLAEELDSLPSYSIDWSTEHNSALTIVDGEGIEVQVAMSKSMKQSIYIYIYGNAYVHQKCSEIGEKDTSESYLKINGVNVKTTQYCQVHEEGEWYITHYANTSKGKSYILKQFRKRKNVRIDGFDISTKGFELVWESAGGDAI